MAPPPAGHLQSRVSFLPNPKVGTPLASPSHSEALTLNPLHSPLPERRPPQLSSPAAACSRRAATLVHLSPTQALL